jgi:Rrf2 family iron-sulfur cluster assembly transcriptional regulator
MNITSKSRYALKIMMDLADAAEAADGLTHRSEIAARQGIPLDYMDHVLSRLREAGLIASTRGRSGGYRLARSRDEISVLQIFMAVEDAFQPVQCLDHTGNCRAEGSCSTRGAWSAIAGAISASLAKIALADLAKAQHDEGVLAVAATGVGIPECRAPRRRGEGAKHS